MKSRKTFIVIGGVLGVLVLVLLFAAIMMRKTIRSDSPGVKYLYGGESMTEADISGRVPYGIVVSEKKEDTIRDAKGNVTEIVTTYTIKLEFSLRRKNSLKIPIETRKGATSTYILKFADKDVTITDGKVVE